MEPLTHFDLSSRVILITGASAGLGARFAQVLAAAGAKIVLGARRLDRLEALQSSIEAAGGQALAVPLDVSDEQAIIRAYDAAEARFGLVNTVVANAGMNAEGTALDVTADSFDAMMGVNVRGVFFTAREAARRLIATGVRTPGHGRIILVSSINASHVAPGIAPYAASKAAVVQMGRSLARDWLRRGISVNVLCPGAVATDMNVDWYSSEGGLAQMAQYPHKRLMQAGDFDGIIQFLASDAMAAVTGSIFTLEDGQTL